MHIRQKALVIAISTLALVPLITLAWTGPTATPPANNVAAPVNVGNVDQVKNGGLGLNSLAVFGNSLLGGSTGSNAYLNFGPTNGTSGYGIRDNAGTLEFKNLGGSWASLQNTIFTLCGGGACGGGGGSWATSGNNIYNSNTGNVGIGTQTPSEMLSVAGNVLIQGPTPLYRFYDPSAAPGLKKAEIQHSNNFSLSMGATDDSWGWVNPVGRNRGVLTISSGGISVDGNAVVTYNGWGVQGLVLEDIGGNPNGNFEYFNNNGGSTIGSISFNGTLSGVLYNTSSDRRIKENIVPTKAAGLDALMRLPVRDFSFKNDPSHKVNTGFIAQELYTVLPDAVTTNGDDGRGPLGAEATPWQVDYGRVTPLLVKAAQEQQAEIESQNAQIQSLKADNAALKHDIEELRSALPTK